MASQAQTSPIPGTAEHAALYLTGHGLGCPHHPKYSIIDTQNPKYPSRVGLFYNGRTDIAYLDTEMLCINCCDAIIPEGFNSWSLFAKLVKMNPGTKPPKRWLNLQSNTSAVKPEDSYPALVQCGAQALSAVASQSQSIIVPMPLQHPEARVAWQWLQDQRKPFYIDHLHLSKGWRPAAERNASLDSPIAEKNGIQFVAGQTAKPNKIPSPGKHTADAPAEKKTKGRTKQKEVTKANQGGVAAEAAISSLGSDVDKEEQQGVTCKKQDHVTLPSASSLSLPQTTPGAYHPTIEKQISRPPKPQVSSELLKSSTNMESCLLLPSTSSGVTHPTTEMQISKPQDSLKLSKPPKGIELIQTTKWCDYESLPLYGERLKFPDHPADYGRATQDSTTPPSGMTWNEVMKNLCLSASDTKLLLGPALHDNDDGMALSKALQEGDRKPKPKLSDKDKESKTKVKKSRTSSSDKEKKKGSKSSVKVPGSHQSSEATEKSKKPKLEAERSTAKPKRQLGASTENQEEKGSKSSTKALDSPKPPSATEGANKSSSKFEPKVAAEKLTTKAEMPRTANFGSGLLANHQTHSQSISRPTSQSLGSGNIFSGKLGKLGKNISAIDIPTSLSHAMKKEKHNGGTAGDNYHHNSWNTFIPPQPEKHPSVIIVTQPPNSDGSAQTEPQATSPSDNDSDSDSGGDTDTVTDPGDLLGDEPTDNSGNSDPSDDEDPSDDCSGDHSDSDSNGGSDDTPNDDSDNHSESGSNDTAGDESGDDSDSNSDGGSSDTPDDDSDDSSDDPEDPSDDEQQSSDSDQAEPEDDSDNGWSDRD